MEKRKQRKRLERLNKMKGKIKRKFPLADILSLTTGTIVSERHVFGIYDILRYMTHRYQTSWEFSAEIFKICRKEILRQHPALSEIKISEIEERESENWLQKQYLRFGKEIAIAPLGHNRQKRRVSLRF